MKTEQNKNRQAADSIPLEELQEQEKLVKDTIRIMDQVIDNTRQTIINDATLVCYETIKLVKQIKPVTPEEEISIIGNYKNDVEKLVNAIKPITSTEFTQQGVLIAYRNAVYMQQQLMTLARSANMSGVCLMHEGVQKALLDKH